MLKGLIGKKVGMTQIFDDAGAPFRLHYRSWALLCNPGAPAREDGYSAVQLGFDEAKPKRLTGGQLGHLKRNNYPSVALFA
jgi:large subunit ribosomal protein L3